MPTPTPIHKHHSWTSYFSVGIRAIRQAFGGLFKREAQQGASEKPKLHLDEFEDKGFVSIQEREYTEGPHVPDAVSGEKLEELSLEDEKSLDALEDTPLSSQIKKSGNPIKLGTHSIGEKGQKTQENLDAWQKFLRWWKS